MSGSLLILGCGFLGRSIAIDALQRGYRVQAVTRNGDTIAALNELGVETFQGMVNDRAWHAFADTSCSAVINCVASAGNGLDGYRASYIEGNRSLVDWTRSCNYDGAVVYTSSVSVYPDAGGASVEEDAAAPDSDRGALILESESIFQGAMASRRVVLRLGGLYGPGRHRLLDRLAASAFDPEAETSYHLNLIRLEDARDAVWVAVEETSMAGVFNVVDDEPCLKRSIGEWVAERAKGSRSAAPQRDAAYQRRRLTPANRRISNAKLKQASSWRPTFPSFREGFADLLAD